jgi:Aspartyl protease
MELPAEATIKLEDSGIPGTTLPVVRVMINGRGPYRAAIETGAGFVAATRAFADSAGLRQTGNADGLPEYLADSIRVGSARFDGIKLSALPGRGATGADLILGLSFFHDVLLVIDYPAGVVRLSRDSLPDANGRDVLALSRVGPFWAAPVNIGGRDLSAVLDTRSAGPAMSLAPGVAAALPFADSLRVVGRASGAAIASTEVKEGRLAGDIRIGSFTFPHPLLNVRELPPGFPTNPLLGDVMLRHFEVSLDQRHARLRLRHDGDPAIVLPEPQRATRGAEPSPPR